MRRLRTSFTVILFSVLALSQENRESTNRACGICEAPFHKVITAPETFIRGAHVTPIPSLDGYDPVNLSTDPMVLAIIVDSSGVPCSVKVLKNGDHKVLSKLRIALKSWQFKTPKYNGQSICLASQLFVYVRKKNEEPVLFIPTRVQISSARRVKKALFW